MVFLFFLCNILRGDVNTVSLLHYFLVAIYIIVYDKEIYLNFFDNKLISNKSIMYLS